MSERTTTPPDRARAVLQQFAQGNLSAGMALMQLAIASTSAREFSQALAGIADEPSLDADRLAQLRALAEKQPDAWRIVREVLAAVPHGPAAGVAGEAAVAACASAFDRAVALSPEASVALYSLGSPALLAVATNEVAACLRIWGVTGRKRTCLDLGCGIGRFEQALARDFGRIIGLDISSAMVLAARQRCADLPNVEIRLASGTQLAGIPDRAVDCVLAIDSFPYIVQAGERVVASQVRETVRVLRPGGDLVIVNYSYFLDPAAERRDLAEVASRYGLEPREFGERPFRSWDGRAFHLIKRRD